MKLTHAQLVFTGLVEKDIARLITGISVNSPVGITANTTKGVLSLGINANSCTIVIEAEKGIYKYSLEPKNKVSKELWCEFCCMECIRFINEYEAIVGARQIDNIHNIDIDLVSKKKVITH